MKHTRKKISLKPLSINRIVVPVDFSEHASNAIRQAAFIAKAFSASIDLLHVITPIYLDDSASLLPKNDPFYSKLLKKTTKRLQEIAQDVSKEGVTVNVFAKLGSINDVIMDHIRSSNAGLVVMGTHGVSGIKEFFAGSNTYRVVAGSPCPVISLQQRGAKKSYKTIVLPITSEMNSRQNVNLVATVAKKFKSHIHIVGYTDKGNDNEKTKVKRYVEQVESFLEKENISCKTAYINTANFTKSILEFSAKNKADLIAIMTSHDFSLDQVVKGSYAQQFVNHSRIPVMCSPDTLEFEYSYENPLTGMLPE